MMILIDVNHFDKINKLINYFVLCFMPYLIKSESNGVTEATKIKISNRLGSSAKQASFQIADSGSLWRPLDDLGS